MVRVVSETEPALLGRLRRVNEAADADGFVPLRKAQTICDVYELPHAPDHVLAQPRDSVSGGSRRLPRAAFGSLWVNPQSWGLGPSDRSAVRHQPITTDILPAKGAPEPLDIVQGAFGSCELLASAAQLTRRYPTVLPQRLHDGDGGVTLRCFPEANVTWAQRVDAQGRNAVLEEFSPGPPIDLRMPRTTLMFEEWNDVAYGACGGGAERPAWPSFLEKAFALTHNRRYYDPSTVALSWLTGCTTIRQKLYEHNREQLFAEVHRHHCANECITMTLWESRTAAYPHAYELLEIDPLRRTLRLQCTADSWLPRAAQQVTCSIDDLGGSIDAVMHTVGAAALLGSPETMREGVS